MSICADHCRNTSGQLERSGVSHAQNLRGEQAQPWSESNGGYEAHQEEYGEGGHRDGDGEYEDPPSELSLHFPSSETHSNQGYRPRTPESSAMGKPYNASGQYDQPNVQGNGGNYAQNSGYYDAPSDKSANEMPQQNYQDYNHNAVSQGGYQRPPPESYSYAPTQIQGDKGQYYSQAPIQNQDSSQKEGQHSHGGELMAGAAGFAGGMLLGDVLGE